MKYLLIQSMLLRVKISMKALFLRDDYVYIFILAQPMKHNHQQRNPHPKPLPDPCGGKLVLLLGHLDQLSLLLTNNNALSQGPPCAANHPMDTYPQHPNLDPNPTPASIQSNTDSQNTSPSNKDPNKDSPSQGTPCTANTHMYTYQ